MSDNVRQENAVYQYTTVDYWHPDPALRPRGVVTVNIHVDGVSLVSGVDVEVTA